VPFPTEVGDYFFLPSIETGPVAHSASYPVGTRDLLPVVKLLRREADHSPLSIVKVKNSPYVFKMRSLIRHRNFLCACLPGEMLN
jgi:hypothetical protein